MAEERRLSPEGGRERLQTIAGQMLPISSYFFHADDIAPCDLYCNNDGNYVLLATKSTLITPPIRRTFDTAFQGKIFIHAEDIDSCCLFLKAYTQRLAKQPPTDPEVFAAVAYQTTSSLIQKAFQDPRAPVLRIVQESLMPLIEVIIGDGDLLRQLVQLTVFDESTYVHSTNVGIFGTALAASVYSTAPAGELCRMSAGFFLHDIGKCLIPHDILFKPSKLTAEEMAVIMKHPEGSATLLEDAGLLSDEASVIALQHHEKDDGSGYPFHLSGDQIHPYAKLCRLVDVYDAITSNRCYHQPRRSLEALKVMKSSLVSDIDAQLFNAFVRLFKE